LSRAVDLRLALDHDRTVPKRPRPEAAGRFLIRGGADVNTIAAALDALAERIARIPPPSARRPDAFHEERSEAASLARAIAEWQRTGRKPVAELEQIEARR
jgi:hypothetical protein